MELFLRTSGAGQSWLNPSVFIKLARTPRVWKAACQTGEGMQGAGWPLPLNLVLMVRELEELEASMALSGGGGHSLHAFLRRYRGGGWKR